MSLIDQGVRNLKAIGFGAALPTERDQLLGALTGSADKEQDEKIKQMQAQIDAANKGKTGGMKSGGKVSSASSRADGIAQRGKTKGRYI